MKAIFDSEIGNTFEVEVPGYQEGQTFELGARPVVIQYKTIEGWHKNYPAIMYRMATIQIVANEIFQYITLTDSIREIIVRRNGALIFRGETSLFEYREPIGPAPYVVNFTAVEPIGRADLEPFFSLPDGGTFTDNMDDSVNRQLRITEVLQGISGVTYANYRFAPGFFGPPTTSTNQKPWLKWLDLLKPLSTRFYGTFIADLTANFVGENRLSKRLFIHNYTHEATKILLQPVEREPAYKQESLVRILKTEAEVTSEHLIGQFGPFQLDDSPGNEYAPNEWTAWMGVLQTGGVGFQELPVKIEFDYGLGETFSVNFPTIKVFLRAEVFMVDTTVNVRYYNFSTEQWTETETPFHFWEITGASVYKKQTRNIETITGVIDPGNEKNVRFKIEVFAEDLPAGSTESFVRLYCPPSEIPILRKQETFASQGVEEDIELSIGFRSGASAFEANNSFTGFAGVGSEYSSDVYESQLNAVQVYVDGDFLMPELLYTNWLAPIYIDTKGDRIGERFTLLEGKLDCASEIVSGEFVKRNNTVL